MLKLIIIFLFLLIAIWIGWEIHQDPGQVIINFRHWQLETSLWLMILLILIGFIVLYALIRLIIRGYHLPKQWRLWRKTSHQQRAEQLDELATCEFIEEKWAAAELDFTQAAIDAKQPLLSYIGAAIAAQAQGNNSKREEYLRRAYQTAPTAELTLGILQTKLQIQGSQFAEAAVTLKKLQSAIPQHPVVKKLTMQLANQENTYE